MAHGACTAPVGFHRFEPVDEYDHSHSGQFNYPTRNFAQLVLKVSQEAGLYLDRSRGADPGRKVSEGSLDFEGLPCGLSPCPSDFYCPLARASTERLCEEFPAYGPVLLRLAFS
jgi:hypothetical protein